MPGSGEIYKANDGAWGFRVRSATDETIATDGGRVYPAKDDARATLQRLLRGDFDGPITDVPTVVCGQEITEDTTLEGDIVCVDGPAFVIAADNVTLDLAGFTVSRHPGSTGAGGPGILLRGVEGATVQKGTITGFNAGVAIMGGGGNTVQNLTVHDNIGPAGGDFGDGITVSDSSENRLQGNTIQRNGPYSGISLVGASQRNQVLENIVADNNMLHVGDPSAGRQDMGIRVEGPAANNNRIEGNTVSGSGADGIVVLPTCVPNTSGGGECVGSPPNEFNEIVDNVSNGNGTSGRGDGIRLFTVAAPVAAAHTTISGNTADQNTTHGISIDAIGRNNPGPTENRVVGNSAHGNGGYDGFDGNVRCGTNIWEGNDFGQANQRCVEGTPTPPTPPTPPAPPMPPGQHPPSPHPHGV
ncbi:MAG: right-handed parallel beta-helix repeat-containing protein [Actinomycetota bacterium]|nr:right-handed parallel beta-helix repeat-containing protein [Actinomycetota bacterium]